MAKAAAKTAQKSNTAPPVVATPTATTLAVGADGVIKFVVDSTLKNYVAEKLIVVSTVDGFRRAGRAWPKEPTEVLVESLTVEQIEALMREPKLQVSVVGKEVE